MRRANRFCNKDCGWRRATGNLTGWALCANTQASTRTQKRYQKALSLSSAVPAEVHVLLADACLQQKKYAQAYTETQTYLQIAPDGPLILKPGRCLSRWIDAQVQPQVHNESAIGVRYEFPCLPRAMRTEIWQLVFVFVFVFVLQSH